MLQLTYLPYHGTYDIPVLHPGLLEKQYAAVERIKKRALQNYSWQQV